MEEVLLCFDILICHEIIVAFKFVVALLLLVQHAEPFLVVSHPVSFVLDSFDFYIVGIVFPNHRLIEDFLNLDELWFEFLKLILYEVFFLKAGIAPVGWVVDVLHEIRFEVLKFLDSFQKVVDVIFV